jgi:hypothetical protein
MRAIVCAALLAAVLSGGQRPARAWCDATIGTYFCSVTQQTFPYCDHSNTCRQVDADNQFVGYCGSAAIYTCANFRSCACSGTILLTSPWGDVIPIGVVPGYRTSLRF